MSSVQELEKKDVHDQRTTSLGYDAGPRGKDFVPPYPPIKRANPIVVLLALIAVLTIASIGVCVIFSVPEEGSPKDPFFQLVEGVNENDGGKILNSTIMKFSPIYEQILSDMLNDSEDDNVTMTVNSLRVLDNDDLTQSQEENATRFLSDVEGAFGIDVRDYRYLSYNITQTYHETTGDRVDYDDDFVLVFKVESEWYLVLPVGV